jgi:hypothetical protein
VKDNEENVERKAWPNERKQTKTQRARLTTFVGLRLVHPHYEEEGGGPERRQDRRLHRELHRPPHQRPHVAPAVWTSILPAKNHKPIGTIHTHPPARPPAQNSIECAQRRQEMSEETLRTRCSTNNSVNMCS